MVIRQSCYGPTSKIRRRPVRDQGSVLRCNQRQLARWDKVCSLEQTPKHFAGGVRFHGPSEWISTRVLAQSSCTILNLVQIWAEDAG